MNTEKYCCLMYHQTTLPALTKYYVGMAAFEEQMKMLREHGVCTVYYDEVAQTEGLRCVITFDDGHASNYDAAVLLHQLGMKAVFYVVKDFCLSRPDYLREEQIKEMSAMGHIIAVHGKDHKHWTKKSDEQLRSELTETRLWIEQLTGKTVNTCAPPGGIINKRVLHCLYCDMPEYEYVRTVQVKQNVLDERFVGIIPMHTNTTAQQLYNVVALDAATWRRYSLAYHTKALLRPAYKVVKKILGKEDE